MMRLSPAWLAAPATLTAASLSVMAGWQRGGWLPERLLWVAIGVVLVVACHLLPALCRAARWPMRSIGIALWGFCMAATCYGHVTFFVLAQRHAGEMRAAALPDAPPAAPRPAVSRSLTAIASDRAAIIGRLARVTAPAVRSSLAARLDALDVEAAEARRQEATVDRATALDDREWEARDALRADPVTSRLAALLGTDEPRVDLLTGMAFAAVLEGVACFCWLLALDTGKHPMKERRSENSPMNAAAEAIPSTPGATDREPESTAIPEPLAAYAAAGNGPVATAVVDTVPDDRARVAEEIAAGRVRCTVADIRRYLGCSQTRALELRRQLGTQGG
ncbi:hypothetical protein [Paraburkholderia pallida]|uniref:Uncharacterized protein n=1 Tax=Paraburkholderia pallida TaxID=2547399 RepID=A0A4V1AZ36_9BURK|nr:hypothetical protein [Paraburkholderia pallida]QBQ97902.1 hypothetical protein E1956_12425 [Paraburkholderia pallida]